MEGVVEVVRQFRTCFSQFDLVTRDLKSTRGVTRNWFLAYIS